MDNSNDASHARSETSALDDMEQVRQLLIGDHQAAQEREISALKERVAKLERLVDALIAHGDASRRAWQAEVSALTQTTPSTVSNRSITQQITPLKRTDSDMEQPSND